MSAQTSGAIAEPGVVKSGAAGSAVFPGSDSRKYNYFEPKGRKATHYEDMTVDVQPDPERYLLQDWIISFPDGTPTYSKDWTAAKSSNWHKFRAVDQEWERTHYQRQSTICGMVQNTIENGRKSGAPARFDPAWVKILQNHLGAYKHAEFGLGTSTMQAQRYGYTQMVNNAILTNSSYKLRFAQDITLYLSEIALDLPGFDVNAGKQHWLEDPIWQGVRKSIESVMGSNDYLEQYFATNAVFEPLVGELFRSHLVQQAAPGNGDWVTPTVVGAAEYDFAERDLRYTKAMFELLTNDREFADHNKQTIQGWLSTWVPRAIASARTLQPLWSQPDAKPPRFEDGLDRVKSRFSGIVIGLGLDEPKELSQ